MMFSFLFAAAFVWLLYTAPWHMVKQVENVNILLGWTVLLAILWHMKAGIHPGMNFHLIGATLFTLMFGWQFASIAMTWVLIAVTFNSGGDWASLPINGVVMIILPTLFTYMSLKLAVKFLPRHFFVYSVINGFLTAAFSMMLVVSSSIALLIAFGGYTWNFVVHKFLPFLPLMSFAEGFFTGMLITGMILFKPEWVMTFSDKDYLDGK